MNCKKTTALVRRRIVKIKMGVMRGVRRKIITRVEITNHYERITKFNKTPIPKFKIFSQNRVFSLVLKSKSS